MKKALRLAVYFLMFTLVSNAAGWTFNEEAVTDVWFDEQRSLVADARHDADGHADSKNISHQSTCNHWCHAIVHFMGLLSQSAFAVPQYFSEYTAQFQVTVQSSSPDELFRPPKATLA